MVVVSGFEPESEASQTTMLILLHHTTNLSWSNDSDQAESDSETEEESTRAKAIPPCYFVLNHHPHSQCFVNFHLSYLTLRRS